MFFDVDVEVRSINSLDDTVTYNLYYKGKHIFYISKYTWTFPIMVNTEEGRVVDFDSRHSITSNSVVPKIWFKILIHSPHKALLSLHELDIPNDIRGRLSHFFIKYCNYYFNRSPLERFITRITTFFWRD